MCYQVITRRRDDLCLPSADDTDVTELHHVTKSHDSVHGPLASHDPVIISHDPIKSCDPIAQTSHGPRTQGSHDITEGSHDLIKLPSHDSSHDMDTLMASLSVFDATHLGRLGTAVSMETESMIIIIMLLVRYFIR